jgi:hypothetical protein
VRHSTSSISFLYAPVAQWIEHWIPNPCAAGPIPAGGTTNHSVLQRLSLQYPLNVDSIDSMPDYNCQSRICGDMLLIRIDLVNGMVNIL